MRDDTRYSDTTIPLWCIRHWTHRCKGYHIIHVLYSHCELYVVHIMQLMCASFAPYIYFVVPTHTYIHCKYLYLHTSCFRIDSTNINQYEYRVRLKISPPRSFAIDWHLFLIAFLFVHSFSLLTILCILLTCTNSGDWSLNSIIYVVIVHWW